MHSAYASNYLQDINLLLFKYHIRKDELFYDILIVKLLSYTLLEKKLIYQTKLTYSFWHGFPLKDELY